jgi:hypothetical protein
MASVFEDTQFMADEMADHWERHQEQKKHTFTAPVPEPEPLDLPRRFKGPVEDLTKQHPVIKIGPHPTLGDWGGIRDHTSENGAIRVREETQYEISPFTSGEYWHLDREFAGRSLFACSGGWPFIDPAGRFLILRDGAVALLFDYETGQAWSLETKRPKDAPPGPPPKVEGAYLDFSFEDGAVLIHAAAEPLKVRPEEFETLFVRGLGRAADGCLTHWRGAEWMRRAWENEKSWLLGG